MNYLQIESQRLTNRCMSNSKVSSLSGFSTLEFALGITTIITLTLFVIDSVNLMRATVSISEATNEVADYVAKLGLTSDTSGSSVLKETTAINHCKFEISSVFPVANFGCGGVHGDNCVQWSLTYPDPSTVAVSIEYDVPMIVLGGYKTVKSFVTRPLEKSYKPMALSEINQATFGH